MNTFLAIDDAYAEWYEQAFGKPIDQMHVLPIKRALQGHPRIWQIKLNQGSLTKLS